MCRNFRARFSSWCLNRISTHATVAVRPPSGADPKGRLRSAQDGEKKETSLSEGDPTEKASSRGWKGVGRRIVIVVDPVTTAAETRSAIQWALTHAVQPNDTLLLLCVCKPTAGGNAGPKRSVAKIHAKENDLLQSMKNLCRSRNPQVKTDPAGYCQAQARSELLERVWYDYSRQDHNLKI